MASGGGKEHRMVFDIRGRRKTGVKVVYAMLAVLMGLSLFVAVGPFNIGELFNSNGGSTEASKQLEEQAERLDVKLSKDPENPELLLGVTRAHVNAGNAGVEVEPSGERLITPAAAQQFQQASQAWSEYLEVADEPNAGVAQLVAPMLITLAEISTGNQIVPNLNAAREAQEIIAKQRPTLNSLTTLAMYQAFDFKYAKAQQIGVKAKSMASTKQEKERIDAQVETATTNAKAFQKALQKYEKEQKQGGGNSQALQSPLGGLGSSSGLGE